MVENGVDLVEANANGVVVEADGDNMQKLFVKSIEGAEDDMAVGDSPALAGSLSHSHLSCTLRNVLYGKKGCACERKPTVVEFQFKCFCRNDVICDERGYYDLEKVRAQDSNWEMLLLRGLKWQVLHARIDIEAPGATHIISS